jgi:hypothetical protein
MMGKQPFPREDKLRFIVQRIEEGATDAEIQEDLMENGPSGKVPRGEYGAFGEVGIRTLRNIRQVYEVTMGLTKSKIKQPDTTLNKANEEHLAQIQALIQKWSNSFETRYHPANMYVWPPHYGVEQDKLFPHVLDHCPSIKDKYQALQSKKNEYQIQSSELKKSQSGQWQQTFSEAERELRDALEMSLLSQEHIRHKCDLCP